MKSTSVISIDSRQTSLGLTFSFSSFFFNRRMTRRCTKQEWEREKKRKRKEEKEMRRQWQNVDGKRRGKRRVAGLIHWKKRDKLGRSKKWNPKER